MFLETEPSVTQTKILKLSLFLEILSGSSNIPLSLDFFLNAGQGIAAVIVVVVFLSASRISKSSFYSNIWHLLLNLFRALHRLSCNEKNEQRMKVRISFTVSRTFHNILLLVVLISDDFDNTLIFSLVRCTLKKKKRKQFNSTANWVSNCLRLILPF